MLDDSQKRLSSAILQTAAYADIFDHPLTAGEIHRYLVGLRVSIKAVEELLEDGLISRRGEYFTLPGREEIIPIRMERELLASGLLPRALRYGRVLGTLPFIRMVALTGSLAVKNVSRRDDFDYMLVAVPGRVWTARAFALLFNRFVRRYGHAVCPNLIVSENMLEWPLHDLYSARELSQMIPVSGMDVYRKLIRANAWVEEFLPNAWDALQASLNHLKSETRTSLSRVVEIPLRSRLGDRVERWEMDRKIARFSKQAGFGEETRFDTEICQGNFHHHRKWTYHEYRRNLRNLGLPSPLPFALYEVPAEAMGERGLEAGM